VNSLNDDDDDDDDDVVLIEYAIVIIIIDKSSKAHFLLFRIDTPIILYINSLNCIGSL